MKIIINEDTYDIVKRIKEIDENYYIVYDTEKQRFEMHYADLPQTFCFIIGDELDSRAIDKIYYTSTKYTDEILEKIDKNNSDLEINTIRQFQSDADYALREIYKFSVNSSKELVNAFQSKWR